MSVVYDDRICKLGEGPLWHPLREQLFWFDILGKCLMTKGHSWPFDEHVSAAGWVDRQTLLIASETALFTFDLDTAQRDDICALEADNPKTRSNDGRADPWGGFWIGTMGKNAEPGAGAIYRYYNGALTRLFGDITISNAICFAPDRICAYFADTSTQTIQRQPLDDTGWPLGDAQVHVDLRAEDRNPDGAIVDADGTLWNAQWGSSRVAGYGPDGQFLTAVDFPACQVSCPALAPGQMFATSAAVGLGRAATDHDGLTFCTQTNAPFQPEYQIVL
ncbi:SMP-30/gluconolactonase/LRE family protein [Parasulfitobacter algicola]|uniref:SMP-30/gluconolactonase/LRE family protein n=1 Tax=Parasulfitobacter algicola TaxID=2614809 RepID=A0ABX2IV97_9RHOB|nr:SMP-30/gluconolactonase/LRE family protein [Sulfitobacter algicola]NSX54118.1 SMP-30/gluconolactonase/LRE family protein [Sulfitobacter algicola]